MTLDDNYDSLGMITCHSPWIRWLPVITTNKTNVFEDVWVSWGAFGPKWKQGTSGWTMDSAWAIKKNHPVNGRKGIFKWRMCFFFVQCIFLVSIMVFLWFPGMFHCYTPRWGFLIHSFGILYVQDNLFSPVCTLTIPQNTSMSWVACSMWNCQQFHTFSTKYSSKSSCWALTNGRAQGPLRRSPPSLGRRAMDESDVAKHWERDTVAGQVLKWCNI